NGGRVSVDAAQGRVRVGRGAVVAEESLKPSFGAVETDIDLQRPAIGVGGRRDSKTVGRAVNRRAGSDRTAAPGRCAIAPTEFGDIVMQLLRQVGSNEGEVADLLRKRNARFVVEAR